MDLPFELAHKTTTAVTKEQIKEMNPNERVPILEDPNTGLTIWETGAIADYIIETYDREAKLTYTTAAEKWAVRTWVYFNVTTQDQYYGQKAYFTLVSAPKITTHSRPIGALAPPSATAASESAALGSPLG